MSKIVILRSFLISIGVLGIAGAHAAADEPPTYQQQLRRGAELKQQAEAKVAQAREQRDSPKRNAQLTAEARGLYAKAQEAFASAIADVEKLLKRGRDPRLDAALVQLRLANAITSQEIAKTYPERDARRAKAMRRAADEFQAVHRAYRRQLAGLYAQFFAADCYQDLGEEDKALAIYRELLELPDGQKAFQDLKKRSLWRAMACWLNQRPPEYERAIWNASNWLKRAEELDDDDPDLLAVHFYLAKAYVQRAAAADENAQKTAAFRFAAGNAQYVAGHSKDRAEAAEELLRGMPAEIVAASPKGKRPPIEDIPSVAFRVDE